MQPFASQGSAFAFSGNCQAGNGLRIGDDFRRILLANRQAAHFPRPSDDRRSSLRRRRNSFQSMAVRPRFPLAQQECKEESNET